MGTVWDNPNQQVVRADESAAWDEGTGGATEAFTAGSSTVDLDAMTKDQLLAYAEQLGLSVDSTMLKSEVRAAIDAHLAAGA